MRAELYDGLSGGERSRAARVRRLRLAVIALAWALMGPGNARAAAGDTQFGVAHVGARYGFTETDALNEGAEVIEDLGARCIKVCLSLDTDNPTSLLYAAHAHWPEVSSLDALADTPYFRTFFARDFDTFILTCFRPGKPAGYWRSQFTETDACAEEECFAALTEFLLRHYGTARKTFVIQTWEGDWAVRGHYDPATQPAPDAMANMTRWLVARQRGVARGRAALPRTAARVYHACEVNLVQRGSERGARSVTTHVLPTVALDLVSYSAWDSMDSPAHFATALECIARHVRPTGAFPGRPVYVGEFGLPESRSSGSVVATRTRDCFREAERFGCPYAVYWQLYCNEPIATAPRTNADYRGFWLVRPDGTRSDAWDMVRGIIERRGDTTPAAGDTEASP